MGRILPPALRPGDRVAIVSPSSPVLSPDRLEAGVALLANWGLEPVLMGNAHLAHGHLAGSDEQRCADLNEAFTDPSIRGVIASRGGYGVTRLLDLLDWGSLEADPKLIVGFSDVSALLLAAWKRLGLVGVHGQFAGRLTLQDASTLALLRRLIMGTEPLGVLPQPADEPVRAVRSGTAQGSLVGGNLSLLASLMGTRDEPETDGAIVFIEEVSEAPYRIDRMLTQLRRCGFFGSVAGVVIGTFVGCEPSGQRPSLTLDEVLDDRLGDLDVPVLAGLAIGHTDRHLPLPVGVPARLDADAGTLELLGAAAAEPPRSQPVG